MPTDRFLKTEYKPTYKWGTWEEKGDTLTLKHIMVVEKINLIHTFNEKYIITSLGYKKVEDIGSDFPPFLLRKPY
jgi:hypothetical protein